MASVSIEDAERVILDLCREMEETLLPTNVWKEMTEQDLWMELVSCILGSQVSYEHADSALRHLCSLGLLDFKLLATKPSESERRIQVELNKPLYLPIRKNGVRRKFRFPTTKARHICRTAINIYSNGNSILEVLHDSKDSGDARNRIMAYCVGVGPKQASLFLRNIGFSSDIAIIDTHVLRFMNLSGIAEKKDLSLSSDNGYFRLEKRFLHYAKAMNVSAGGLDRVIWSVMRMTHIGDGS
ncbi:MAG: hypothetical protein ACE5KV_02310 [Thermoplasmata archaeon]